ncbi:MAG: 3'-5' exonuclease [Spirochaetaceae bacterium]|jgi:DNA polymerase III epsilon subunit-like protein|nr:3'-5' exonuclease [Spirochaetaceae bacterium]
MSGTMIQLWCDTETTGINPAESGAFELAFLIYEDAELKAEKVYNLNPLNDTIRFGEEAFKVNGVSEEMIRSYPAAEEVMPEVAVFLEQYAPPEKMVFAGYRCGFDYGHIAALLTRCGYSIGNYCNGRMIDVLELVKKAEARGVLVTGTKNKKLETMTKALGIPHGAAHTALSDIKAARQLYEAIYRLSCGKNDTGGKK